MNQFFTKIIISLFIAFAAAGFNSCTDSGIDPFGLNLFSPSDDMRLGMQLDSQIQSKPSEFPILSSTSARFYLQTIVDKIILSPSIKYRDEFYYHVQIIKNDNVVNAFATPGGYIYVYTGLLKFVDNEATIAGIIAHEIAHAERRHATKRMTSAYGVQLLLGLLLGENPTKLEEISANLLAGLMLLKNSRDDELEADEYSFKYLQTSQWYPGAILFFFTKVDNNGSAGFLEELISTHPPSKARADAINNLLKNAGTPQPTEVTLYTKRYQDFVKTLP